MKLIVIGSGLIGVTAAYFLRRRGYEVTVVDREEGPGRETSFANAGLLTPSMAQPWNAPGSWRLLASSLGRSDSAMQLRLKALPTLAGWGVTFLRNSRPQAFERNTRSNLNLALYSRNVMQALRQESAIEYGRSARGTLSVFRDRPALDRATEGAARLSAEASADGSGEGLGFRRLSTHETIALEPALVPIAPQLAGALHYEIDETGDAYRFCVELTRHAESQGVEFHFRTEVSALRMSSGRIAAVYSGRRRFEADRYVVAAGSYSTPLLQGLGIRLPVRPVKGYSVTFDNPDNRVPLGLPVVDDQLHAVVTPLPGVIRVAGTAEFVSYDRLLDERRVRNLLGMVKRVLPEAPLDRATSRAWCGLRAMSADGVPLIGFTGIPNLLVSTGHGHLGWTQAAGSARLLTELVSGEAPAIDPAPYDPKRFTALVKPT